MTRFRHVLFFYRFSLLAAALVSVVAICPKALAEQPDPHQTVAPDAYSLHDALWEIEKFNQKTLLEAYNKHGVKDPAWDKDAGELLESMAKLFTYNGSHSEVYVLDEFEKITAKYRNRYELADLLIASKCKDPLVLYLIGTMKAHAGDDADARAYYERAHEGFKKTDYSSYRKFYAVRRLIESYENFPSKPKLDEKRIAWGSDYIDLLIQGFAEITEQSSYTVRDNMLQSLTEAVINKLNRRTPEDRIVALKFILDQLEVLKQDHEWGYYSAKGTFLVEYAWAHRSDGYANTVDQQQWRNFEKYLVQARESLQNAWQIEPSVMIAQQMIPIAMAGHAAPGEDERLWFDRATEMMFDDPQSWDSMVYSLRPRWGGSHIKMMEIAIEAVNTGRFDTPIPYRGAQILSEIEAERGDSEFWSNPKVIDAMDRLCRGMDASPLRDDQPELWFVLLRAAYMWKGRAYDKAILALDEAGDLDDEQIQIARNAFRRVRADYEESLGQIYAYTSSSGERIKGAMIQLQRGQLEQAKEQFAEIMRAGDDLHPMAKEFIQIQLNAIAFQEQFATGKWVQLGNTDNALLDWQKVYGSWEVDEQGGLIGKGDKVGLKIVFKHPIQGPWELQCDTEVIHLQDNEWANAGVITRYQSPNNTMGFWVFPNLKQVAQDWGDWSFRKPKPFIKPGLNTIKIRQDKGKILRVFVNKKSIWKYSEHHPDDPRRFGLSTEYDVKGDAQVIPDIGITEIQVRYSNIKIRSLPRQ